MHPELRMGWEARTGSDITHVIKKEVLACAPGAGALPAPAARASTALRDSSACVRCSGALDERPAFGPGAELWAHGGIEGQVMSISHPAALARWGNLHAYVRSCAT